MIDLLPRLSNIRVRRVWRGCYPQTPDGMPIVGEAQQARGYFYAAGLCGQGLMLGPGLAQDLANLMITGKPITEDSAWRSLSLQRSFKTTESLK